MVGTDGGPVRGDADVTGVYEHALGDAAADLHPNVRDRYALDAEDDAATVGSGRMEITRGTLALPALYAMTARNMLFPESGTDVPFTVTTVGHRTDDGHGVDAGYEALTTRREFDFDGKRRRFDSLTVWDPGTSDSQGGRGPGGRLLDYLGTGGLLVSELHPRVEDGALVVEGGRQWARLGNRYAKIPGPLAADVTVRDRYDESDERFHVVATVESAVAGTVLTYRGSFTQEQEAQEMTTVPDDLRPTRAVTPLPPR